MGPVVHKSEDEIGSSTSHSFLPFTRSALAQYALALLPNPVAALSSTPVLALSSRSRRRPSQLGRRRPSSSSSSAAAVEVSLLHLLSLLAFSPLPLPLHSALASSGRPFSCCSGRLHRHALPSATPLPEKKGRKGARGGRPVPRIWRSGAEEPGRAGRGASPPWSTMPSRLWPPLSSSSFLPARRCSRGARRRWSSRVRSPPHASHLEIEAAVGTLLSVDSSVPPHASSAGASSASHSLQWWRKAGWSHGSSPWAMCFQGGRRPWWREG